VKSLVRILKRLFIPENALLTIAVIAALIIILLDIFQALPAEVERNAVLFLLGLLAT